MMKKALIVAMTFAAVKAVNVPDIFMNLFPTPIQDRPLECYNLETSGINPCHETDPSLSSNQNWCAGLDQNTCVLCAPCMCAWLGPVGPNEGNRCLDANNCDQ